VQRKTRAGFIWQIQKRMWDASTKPKLLDDKALRTPNTPRVYPYRPSTCSPLSAQLSFDAQAVESPWDASLPKPSSAKYTPGPGWPPIVHASVSSTPHAVKILPLSIPPKTTQHNQIHQLQPPELKPVAKRLLSVADALAGMDTYRSKKFNPGWNEPLGTIKLARNHQNGPKKTIIDFLSWRADQESDHGLSPSSSWEESSASWTDLGSSVELPANRVPNGTLPKLESLHIECNALPSTSQSNHCTEPIQVFPVDQIFGSQESNLFHFSDGSPDLLPTVDDQIDQSVSVDPLILERSPSVNLLADETRPMETNVDIVAEPSLHANSEPGNTTKDNEEIQPIETQPRSEQLNTQESLDCLNDMSSLNPDLNQVQSPPSEPVATAQPPEDIVAALNPSNGDEVPETEEEKEMNELFTRMEQPRPYQLELFCNAVQQNVIAVLPTGSGKTMVAIMLLRHVFTTGAKSEETATDSQSWRDEIKKKALFLVNKVSIATVCNGCRGLHSTGNCEAYC
jgi:hypothetical protein